MKTRIEYFKEFLNFFWLRPENAIMLSLRAEKYAQSLKLFDKDSIDVSCGDGVFSFLTFGGGIDPSCDMFQSLNVSQRRKGDFDAFDHFDEKYSLIINNKPIYKYKYGTDWKKNLLKKAKQLSFYDNLLEHDNNKLLPFNDESFGYTYSNSAYWVERFEDHIKDLIRITKTGGVVVLELKTTNIKSYNALNYASPIFGNKFGEIIDAGRLETWRGLKSYNEYVKIIEKMGDVNIKYVSPIYGDMLAYIWDIGVRPLFNPLFKLTNSVDENTRLSAKREWCEIFMDLFSDFLTNYEANKVTAIEWMVTIEKK